MNYSDSERIAAVLETAGYKKTLSEDDADLIVINACSVRQSAIDRISGRFKKYKRLRKANPGLKIVLTGCVLENNRKKFEKMFDLIVGIEKIERIVKSPLPPFNKGGEIIPPLKKRVRMISSNYFQIKPLRQSKFSAYVPIMTGCNNFCAYCVVPYTRGREYSRPAEEILSEIRDLVKQGYKEIILLGQNVNSYRSKIPNTKYQIPNEYQISNFKQAHNSQLIIHNSNNINFPTLLKLINDIPGNFWIRFLTSHPKDMSEELIKTVAECEKVTPYIHLALQSGDDEILKKMNRKYTAEHFLELVKMIRKYIPDAAISTDIIVGFPGETEKQFQNTATAMKEAKFDMAYINKYSSRPGTAATKLNDNVSWQEKRRREKILTEILKKTAIENNKKYTGKIVEVLVDELRIEKLRNKEIGILFGKTKSFKNVKIDIGNWILDIKRNNKQYGNIYYHTKNKKLADIEASIKQYDNTYYHTESLIGKFLNIKITQAGAWGLEGRIIKF